MFSFLKLASISIPLIFSQQNELRESESKNLNVSKLPIFSGSTSYPDTLLGDLTIPKNSNSIFLVGQLLDNDPYRFDFPGGVLIQQSILSGSYSIGSTTDFSLNSVKSSLDGDKLAINISPSSQIIIGGPNAGITCLSASNADISNPLWTTGVNYFSPPQIEFSQTDNSKLYAFIPYTEFFLENDDVDPYPKFSGSATFLEFNADTGSVTKLVEYNEDILSTREGFAITQDRFFILDSPRFLAPSADQISSFGTIYVGTLSEPSNLSPFTLSSQADLLVTNPSGTKLFLVDFSNEKLGTGTGTISRFSILDEAPFLAFDSSVAANCRSPLYFNNDESIAFFTESNNIFGKTAFINSLDVNNMIINGSIAGVYAAGPSMAVQPNFPFNLYNISNVDRLFFGENSLLKFTYQDGPPVVPVFSGQAAQMANYFNLLIQNSQLPQDTLAILNQISTLPIDQQNLALVYLSPQFKIAQFTQEKLDLLIHKEMQGELYSNSKDLALFATAGFDHLNQGSSQGYTGYNVTNYYQLFGLSFEACKVKWLTAVGVSESYLKLDPLYSKANYVTTYGAFGFGGNIRKFQLGVDALFGYSFLDTYRKVVNLGNTAKSDHGLWNISVDANFAYKIEKGRSVYTPYDLVGYLYGSENQYTEKGAPGDNFQVKDENISIFRNQLGIKYSRLVDENINAFVDTAWLYEYYTNDNSYKARLVGAELYGTFSQKLPAKNFGRVNAGFEGLYKHFNWKLAFTGLYGHNFSDSSLSLKIGYKF